MISPVLDEQDTLVVGDVDGHKPLGGALQGQNGFHSLVFELRTGGVKDLDPEIVRLFPEYVPPGTQDLGIQKLS